MDSNKKNNAGLTKPLFISRLKKREFPADCLKDLKDSLYKEKLRTEKVFKEREKQIDTILTNMVGFHGSIKGIAGASVSDFLLIEESGGNLIE